MTRAPELPAPAPVRPAPSGEHRPQRRGSDRRRASDLLVVVPTFLVLGLIAFPAVWMVFTSLRPPQSLATQVPFTQMFDGLSLEAYSRLFDGSSFGRYVGNSLVVSLVSTACTVVLASVAAYGLSRFRFRLRGSIVLLVIATQLLPFVVLITPIYIAFAEMGLLNSYVGLVVVYTAMTLPLAIVLTLGYFESIPQVLDEAARIDGCSTLGVIFRVIIPVAAPGIVTVAVTTFIATWEEYLFASVLMTTDELKTVQVGLAGYFGEYATDWSLIMAGATVAAVPTLILFAVVQKRIVSGLSAGSVKG